MPKKRTGSLTLRILAVNLIAPIVLVAGLLYVGQYRDTLIESELETLKVEARLFAEVIADGAVGAINDPTQLRIRQAGKRDVLIDELSRTMIRRLAKASNNRTRLFDQDGKLVTDSHRLTGPDGVIDIDTLPPPNQPRHSLARHLQDFTGLIMNTLPATLDLPLYIQPEGENAETYLDAQAVMDKEEASATAWQTENRSIMLSAAAPVKKNQAIVGVLHFTQQATNIESVILKLRTDVLTLFLASLSLTIFLSLYLASVIGRPLKKLAKAAEIVRQGQGRRIDIPDLRYRNDEIGELSQALHDMTQALRDRMDAIETFAADVSHELKNPLSSLRSAIETVTKVESEKDQKRLLKIIEHDVQRLDRLISDISRASRIDAELVRDEYKDVDLKDLLTHLSDMHQSPLERAHQKDHSADDSASTIKLIIPAESEYIIRGIEGQLAQVFDNLITNALSFSPKDTAITIAMSRTKNNIVITVDDKGPGIPDNKLEDIFDRFYSERPDHENYGSHSGLGLSIARQIVTAHGGEIYAQNLSSGETIEGARFTVGFPVI